MELSLSSGQSLVIGPAAVEHLFEVWFCSFACVAECVRSLFLRKHAAICLQFECSGCRHVTDTFVLFSWCTAAFHVSRGKLRSCTHFFRSCKRLSCSSSFPMLVKVCLKLIGDLIFGMQRMLSEVLFSPSAINPVSAQVWSSVHLRRPLLHSHGHIVHNHF